MIYGLTLSFCSSGLRRCDKCAKKPPESLVIPSLESLRYIKTLFGKSTTITRWYSLHLLMTIT